MVDILSRWYGGLPYLYIFYKGGGMWKLEINFSDEEVVTFQEKMLMCGKEALQTKLIQTAARAIPVYNFMA